MEHISCLGQLYLLILTFHIIIHLVGLSLSCVDINLSSFKVGFNSWFPFETSPQSLKCSDLLSFDTNESFIRANVENVAPHCLHVLTVNDKRHQLQIAPAEAN